MVSERAHNGLNKIVKLVFADARRTYQVPHLATKVRGIFVRTHQFHVSHMCSKCGNCHRKKRFMHLFDTCKRTNFTISVTFAGFGIVGEMLLKYCKSLLYKELS